MTRLIDLLALSRRVAADAGREPEIGRAAIAWVFVNRAREASGHVCGHGLPHPVWGDGSLRDACLRHGGGPAGARRAYNDPALCRALATACLVCCRDIADPTSGATHYHHHRETPGWANVLTPRALIGSYLFYGRGR